MAKTNRRLKDFFEGRRRMCRLQDYRPLKDRSDVRRWKMMLSMSLTGQPVLGMPDEFTEEFSLMVRKNSVTNFKKINVEIEGAKFSVFETDTAKGESVLGHGATLNGFKLVAAGIEEKRTVDLEFSAYVPWSDSLRDWLGEHIHSDFFLEVVPSQMELQEGEEKPAKEKKRKKDSAQTSFDPAKIQDAAKRGEVVQ